MVILDALASGAALDRLRADGLVAGDKEEIVDGRTARVNRHARLSMECRRNRLEKRYRRLLLLYPAQHRREHGEQMLGALLASAFDGHRVRSVADAADVVAGAARIRTRMLARRGLLKPVADRRWNDALAVVSVIAPVLLVVAALSQFNVPQATASALTGYPYNPLTGGFYIPDWPLTIGAPLVALLAAVRLRRCASALAVLIALAQVILPPAFGISSYASPALAFAVLLALTAAAALFLSEGPARGLVLLRWWRTALIAVAATILGGFSLGGTVVLSSGGSGGFTNIIPAEVAGLPGDILIAGGLALAGLGCLFTPVTRRILALLAIPLIPYTIIWQDKLASDLIGQLSMISIPSSAVLLYLPPLAVAAAIVTGTQVSRRRHAA